ncbi:MAG TPA: hypothetical protein VGM73_04580 [Candidatus Didemnitutus sp.]|jgi:hypothetical protein
MTTSIHSRPASGADSTRADPQLRQHSDMPLPQHGRGRAPAKDRVGAAHRHRQKSHSTSVGSGDMREREAGDVDRQINRLDDEPTEGASEE